MLKTVKVSLTLPEELLKQIKAMTNNVSAFVTEGMRQYIAKERVRQALEQSAGVWSRENHPDLTTIKRVEEYVREIRSEWRPKN